MALACVARSAPCRSSLVARGGVRGACSTPRAPSYRWRIFGALEIISRLRKLGKDQKLLEKTQFRRRAHVHTEKCYTNITCFK